MMRTIPGARSAHASSNANKNGRWKRSTLSPSHIGGNCRDFCLRFAQRAGRGPAHVFFHVQAAASLPGPVSGRLLIFVKQGSGDKEVETSEFRLEDTWVAAREIHDLAPGASVEVDADEISYPKPFTALAPGTYEAQAVLDVDHTYNYSGRGVTDWESGVIAMSNWTPGAGAEPALTIDHHPEENPRRVEAIAKAKSAAGPGVAQLEEMESPLLTRFWGHPREDRGVGGSAAGL